VKATNTPKHLKILAKTEIGVPEIQTISIGSVKNFQEFAETVGRGGKPIIINFEPEGGSERKITELAEIFGNSEIKIRTGDFSNPNNYLSDRKYENLLFLDYFKNLRKNPTSAGYLGNFPLTKEQVSKLLQKDLLDLSPLECVANSGLWLGPSGATTPLHRDSADNFAFHLYGSKRWYIFPPSTIESLNMKHVDVPGRPEAEFATSDLDLRNSNVLKQLRESGVNWLDVTVSGGPILYVPTDWPHFVQTLSESLMVSTWLVDGEELSPLVLTG
jgi:hypothetical protein